MASKNTMAAPTDRSADIKYIQLIASQARVPLAGVDIDRILAATLPGDKRRLNAELFSSPIEPTLIDAPVSLDESAVLAMFADSRSRQVDLLNNEMSEVEYRMNDFRRRHLDRRSHVIALRHQIEALKASSAQTIITEIKRACEIWDYRGVKNGCIRFTSKADHVMHEKNSAAGVDRTVNLGRFQVLFKPENGNLWVCPWRDNVKSAGHFHPYLGSEHGVCFGDAAMAYDKAAIEMRIYDLMKLLLALLNTYSPTSTPYVQLHRFASQAGLNGARTAVTPDWHHDDEIDGGHTCPSCEGSREDCACLTCERCNWRSSDQNCPDHWCSICESFSRQSCECCSNCENSQCTCESEEF